MSFKERLKQLRKEKGLTQDELAKVLNYTRAAISGYEIGRNEPSYEVLQQLAHFFDVSIDYLLGHTDKPNHHKNASGEKSYYSVDISGLPENAIREVESYVEYVKQKYKSDENYKKG